MIIALIITNLINKIAIALLSKNYKGIELLKVLNILEILLVIVGVYEVIINKVIIKVYLNEWINKEYLSLGLELKVDTLSMILIMVVSIVSVMVQTYSISYMEGDPHKNRFMGLLNMFTMFMVTLVCGSDLITIFIGWEGIGLVSYLLVSFWFTRAAANRSALMAYLVNRVGDLGYIIGILLIIYYFKSSNITLLISLSPVFNETFVFYSIIALAIGVIAKSSQIGLHTWLPHAMEGPTPVSALLHAATLVTAGVYLLLRIAPYSETSSTSSALLCILGGATAFVGGTLGLVANDLKRIIAFSTFSQLGYMIYAIGTLQYNISMYHLTNHAFFKALLFLSAGSIIHGLSDEQDLKKAGGLKTLMPFTYLFTLLPSLSILGIPYTTGFYSKETILSMGFSSDTTSSLIGYYLCLIAALLTAIYSFRALINTFFTTYQNSPKVLINIMEPTLYMKLPLILLGILAITSGYAFTNVFYIDFINSGIKGYNYNFNYYGGGSIALILTLVGIGIAIIMNLINFKGLVAFTYNNTIFKIFNALTLRYYFDSFYSKTFTKGTLTVSYFFSRELDKGIGEFLGPNGAYNLIFFNSKYIQRFAPINPNYVFKSSPIFFALAFIASILISITLILI